MVQQLGACNRKYRNQSSIKMCLMMRAYGGQDERDESQAWWWRSLGFRFDWMDIWRKVIKAISVLDHYIHQLDVSIAN